MHRVHKETYISKMKACNIFVLHVLEVSSVVDGLRLTRTTAETEDGRKYDASFWSCSTEINFNIQTKTDCFIDCDALVFIGSEKVLCLEVTSEPQRLREDLYIHNLISLSPNDECFLQLNQYPKESFTLVCRMVLPLGNYIRVSSYRTPFDEASVLSNLKKIADVFRNFSNTMNEKVLLQVGEETETVSKCVLTARYPVYVKMFENDVQRMNENRVTITGIEMPVLKALVSFLYSGKLGDYDLSSLYNLCLASKKYGMSDLREACIDSMLEQICKEKIFIILKIAFNIESERLKFIALAFFAANIETLITTDDWRNLVDTEQDIVVKIYEFIDF